MGLLPAGPVPAERGIAAASAEGEPLPNTRPPLYPTEMQVIPSIFSPNVYDNSFEYCPRLTSA